VDGTRARAAFAVLVLASAARIAAAAASPALSTSGGSLQGIERDGVVAYLGIPYAVPPVGALRWRPPQGLPHWSGIRVADHYGNDCLQVRRAPSPEQRPASEDCLYLNVWAPARTGTALLPVIVWVHGGGFFAGSGSQPLYDGADLARRGVVVVNLNYRLGRFGFFAHPALARESPEGPIGNYGLLDQIAALKWVVENIAAFGGDSRNVTLCGQSAGGASVSYLMASPYARGLFQKAVIESGIFRGAPETLEQAEAAAQEAARAWGAADANITALRNLSSLQVLSVGPAGRVGPMIDGHVVPEDVMAAFAAGRVAHVPLLIGSNSYESGFFPARAQGMAQRYAARWPEVTAVFDGYGTHETAAIEGQLATDQLITAPTWSVARAAAAHGLPTYLYYFSYVRPSQRGHVPGASHIDEVYALFDKMSLVEKETGADTQRIVDEVQSRWVQFARTGQPGAKPADWPALSSRAFRVLEFTNTGPRVRNDFASARLQLADSLAAPPAAK